MNTPSEIAIECVTNLLAHNSEIRRYELLLASHQSAIDKSTAGMVPIEDVKPLLFWKNGQDYDHRIASEAFLALHGEKLK